MLSSRREAFLPCPLPASRSTTSVSQPPPDCFVLLGPGDSGGGGRVQQRQLPGLRRPFPDWRPGSSLALLQSCQSSFLAAGSSWLQRLQAARLPPRLSRGLACKVQNLLILILCVIPHPRFLLRHSTCPVCRQTLAIEEEELGYDGGDESEDGE